MFLTKRIKLVNRKIKFYSSSATFTNHSVHQTNGKGSFTTGWSSFSIKKCMKSLVASTTGSATPVLTDFCLHSFRSFTRKNLGSHQPSWKAPFLHKCEWKVHYALNKFIHSFVYSHNHRTDELSLKGFLKKSNLFTVQNACIRGGIRKFNCNKEVIDIFTWGFSCIISVIAMRIQ